MVVGRISADRLLRPFETRRKVPCEAEEDPGKNKVLSSRSGSSAMISKLLL